MTDMDNDLIGSDHPFTTAEQTLLQAVADTLLPGSPERGLPSAGELDVAGCFAAMDPAHLVPTRAFLSRLDADFAQQPLETRAITLQGISELEPEAFTGMLKQVYTLYYEDERVLTGIGIAAGPPFPRGNNIEQGDLSLLNPVIESDRGYRKT